MLITRIISGCQTGVDRAAVDTAIELGIQHGGWVPKGRTAEDGELNHQYHVRETPSPDVNLRTEWNVRDSDATLIISSGQLTGGSRFTQQMAHQYKRPLLHIDLVKLSIPEAVEQIIQWLYSTQVGTLNIAGPRRSEDSEIYQRTKVLLRTVLLLGKIERYCPFC
ncbi:hypothetical protein S7335_701 [Synechococcus sp. PCC 7335]|uniref:putative molybdenum carrier protein n=1 Tax=Synechococcus sp. (strain ATCC 29403 / PCC 7335) TaxID=91464 RepID=UPI00017EE10A|nr:putative molybdenum carrier protein [Synechococcus sp. PCC 7335]EDX83521.1 hypothetical protein S7335_701 [Synechococcus sp. PCC 7335]